MVKLDGLADGDVGEVAGVLLRELRNDAKLARCENAVGDGDAHHEVIGGDALAALAAGGAHAVALGIDSPPLEVERGPLGHHAGAAFAGEGAHFIERFPRILFPLQALGALRFGLFCWNSFGHDFPFFSRK